MALDAAVEHTAPRQAAPRQAAAPPRLSDVAVWPVVVAFTGCLTVVAVSSALGGLSPWLGLAALVLVAVVSARRTRPLGAAAIGALTWLFYDGFLADALTRGYQPGALHWHGTTSSIALGLLIVLATAASFSTPTTAGEPRHG